MVEGGQRNRHQSRHLIKIDQTGTTMPDAKLLSPFSLRKLELPNRRALVRGRV
jgi:hypothetical protein